MYRRCLFSNDWASTAFFPCPHPILAPPSRRPIPPLLHVPLRVPPLPPVLPPSAHQCWVPTRAFAHQPRPRCPPYPCSVSLLTPPIPPQRRQ
jgi:hypothetical protein